MVKKLTKKSILKKFEKISDKLTEIDVNYLLKKTTRKNYLSKRKKLKNEYNKLLAYVKHKIK